MDEDRSFAATVTKVPAAITATPLLPFHYVRNSGSVYNDSSAILYVKLGDGATTDDWTVKLNQDDYYDLPDGYIGSVSGVWATATGQARVTETF